MQQIFGEYQNVNEVLAPKQLQPNLQGNLEWWGSIVSKDLDEVVEDKHLTPLGEILIGQIDFEELLAEIRF